MSEKPPSQAKGLSYRDAGVNIDAADEALHAIKGIVKKTFDDRVLQDIGSFGAMYDFSNYGMANPVLVSSVDGVGTKLKLAFMTGRHDTVGIDLVSHCVNDILVQGARPLFFLDYLAFGVLQPAVVADVIRGVATGCRYAGCALIGGETAEMPQMYTPGEYDLAGMIVGVVDRERIVDGHSVEEGDVVIGIASSGLHTNGYSLARKICFEVAGLGVDDPMPGVGRTVGDALLEPHRSYAKLMQVVMAIVSVKAMAHITGGGITDNLPRSLPEHLGAEIDVSTWEVPPLFRYLQEAGNVADLEMLRTFNMGMGFLVVVSEKDTDKAIDVLEQAGEKPRRIGRVVAGDRKIRYVGSLRYAE
ncbi:MAG TPA: phosphoribosylformylglycinamidine cyclo-ligase [Candidatus Hydrogenedentes bacterium]|nr:phosphoribosylformylglycinamidine cyclo-ligase [Candidatus Hydrogenedentota bacterium]HPG67981.1 phosphoribosylformylglycinamidine cyclo-ligase [Candidatus Hydrogenedentota bacterium]